MTPLLLLVLILVVLGVLGGVFIHPLVWLVLLLAVVVFLVDRR